MSIHTQLQFSEYILDCLRCEIKCYLQDHINDNLTDIDIMEILIKKLIEKRMNTKNLLGKSVNICELIDIKHEEL